MVVSVGASQGGKHAGTGRRFLNMTWKHKKPAGQSGGREAGGGACARLAGEGPEGNLRGLSRSEVTEDSGTQSLGRTGQEGISGLFGRVHHFPKAPGPLRIYFKWGQ